MFIFTGVCSFARDETVLSNHPDFALPHGSPRSVAVTPAVTRRYGISPACHPFRAHISQRPSPSFDPGSRLQSVPHASADTIILIGKENFANENYRKSSIAFALFTKERQQRNQVRHLLPSIRMELLPLTASAWPEPQPALQLPRENQECVQHTWHTLPLPQHPLQA